MKNLILVRHAKSSWDTLCQDIDRPIEPRGEADAFLVATECLKHLPLHFELHSSVARRARETALIFANTISYPIERIIFRDDLYTFDADKLELIIKSNRNDLENVILFGHNDAITNFVNKFGAIFIDNVPTSGFVWLEFDTDRWDKIEKGKIVKTIFPRNLK